MKKFNLERALAGDPVCMGNGKKVTGLHLFDGPTDYPLVGVVDGKLLNWTVKGVYLSGNPYGSKCDLYMHTEFIERWVNYYNVGEHVIQGVNWYRSEKEAKANVSKKHEYRFTAHVFAVEEFPENIQSIKL